MSNSGIPHYDITESKQRLAIKLGAKFLKRNEYVEKMREIRMEIKLRNGKKSEAEQLSLL